MEQKYYLILFFIVLLVFSWWYLFFKKKKSKYLSFSLDWKNILSQKVQFYNMLSDLEKARFEQNILHFFERVTITGVKNEINDTDRLLVAASAVIPLFGFPGWEYRNLNEVLLYENTFNDEYQTREGQRNILGQVGSGAMNRMMILSKPALHQGFENPTSKNNVGIHEFVHLLDKADGSVDGIPEILMQQQFVIPWLKLMHQEIEIIQTQDSDINPYGATNEAEFLSVVSEYFFNQPHEFQAKHPQLFSLMEKIFRQDFEKNPA